MRKRDLNTNRNGCNVKAAPQVDESPFWFLVLEKYDTEFVCSCIVENRDEARPTRQGATDFAKLARREISWAVIKSENWHTNGVFWPMGNKPSKKSTEADEKSVHMIFGQISELWILNISKIRIFVQ